jgi:hypothetical protein
MATKKINVSDLTDREAPDNVPLVRLVVRKYPDVEGARKLEVLPDEVNGLQEDNDLVHLEVSTPGSSTRKTLVVPRADFDQLAPDGNMRELIEGARTLKPRGRPRKDGM